MNKQRKKKKSNFAINVGHTDMNTNFDSASTGTAKMKLLHTQKKEPVATSGKQFLWKNTCTSNIANAKKTHPILK